MKKLSINTIAKSCLVLSCLVLSACGLAGSKNTKSYDVTGKNAEQIALDLKTFYYIHSNPTEITTYLKQYASTGHAQVCTVHNIYQSAECVDFTGTVENQYK